jgi:protein-S-isoprenylcysteine O-methyltransferase Ste14
MSIRWGAVIMFIVGLIILALGVGFLRQSSAFGSTVLSLLVMFFGLIIMCGAWMNLEKDGWKQVLSNENEVVVPRGRYVPIYENNRDRDNRD